MPSLEENLTALHNGMKILAEENELLRKENSELREKLKSTDCEKLRKAMREIELIIRKTRA